MAKVKVPVLMAIPAVEAPSERFRTLLSPSVSAPEETSLSELGDPASVPEPMRRLIVPFKLRAPVVNVAKVPEAKGRSVAPSAMVRVPTLVPAPDSVPPEASVHPPLIRLTSKVAPEATEMLLLTSEAALPKAKVPAPIVVEPV